jgi:biopolymer transport protein ExbB
MERTLAHRGANGLQSRPRFNANMENLILLLLVLTSVVSVTFIIERAFALRWTRVIPPGVEEAARNCRSDAELPMLHRICKEHPSALSRLFVAAATHLDCPRAENVEALQTRARHEIARLERGIVVLEIVTGIAPLLGLTGTIYGLIMLFGNMGVAAADSTRFAGGIALALRATLMGLLIAIPSLVAWSYFTRKVETLAVELESQCDDFLRRFYGNGGQRTGGVGNAE